MRFIIVVAVVALLAQGQGASALSLGELQKALDSFIGNKDGAPATEPPPTAKAAGMSLLDRLWNRLNKQDSTAAPVTDKHLKQATEPVTGKAFGNHVDQDLLAQVLKVLKQETATGAPVTDKNFKEVTGGVTGGPGGVTGRVTGKNLKEVTDAVTGKNFGNHVDKNLMEMLLKVLKQETATGAPVTDKSFKQVTDAVTGKSFGNHVDTDLMKMLMKVLKQETATGAPVTDKSLKEVTGGPTGGVTGGVTGKNLKDTTGAVTDKSLGGHVNNNLMKLLMQAVRQFSTEAPGATEKMVGGGKQWAYSTQPPLVTGKSHKKIEKIKEELKEIMGKKWIKK